MVWVLTFQHSVFGDMARRRHSHMNRQTTLQVPGRVISLDPIVKRALLKGEKLFDQIGCAFCQMMACFKGAPAARAATQAARRKP